MKRTDFFKLLRFAVQHQAAPASGLLVDQLQSFSVIRSRNDVNSESGARSIFDTDSPYFYSRRFNNTARLPQNMANEMPGLFALPTSSELTRLGKGRLETSIQLICLFPSEERVDPDKMQKLTPVEEIDLKAVAHLNYILGYLQNSVCAEVQEPGGGKYFTWANEGYLDHLETEGEIALYNIDQNKTNAFQRRFLALNEGVNVDYVDNYSTHKLSGAYITLTLPETSALCSAETMAVDFSNC